MISSDMLLSIFFRILNFVVFVGVLRYLYKRYIKDAVQQDFLADEKKVAIMAQQKDAYHQQEQFLMQEMQAQEQLVSQLEQKLETWRSAAQDVQRVYNEEHALLQARVRKKAAEQSEHIAQYMLERRALPKAMHELESSLADYFSSEKRASRYINDVMQHVDKER